MRLAFEWLPEQQPAPQLLVLLHGVGGAGATMLPLAEALRAQFPQAAIVAPDAPHPFDGGPNGRQWFSASGVTDDNRVPRVQAALGPLRDWIVATQQRLGVGPMATCIAGFSQGAILGLELSSLQDGLVGRVLAFGGRYAQLPAVAPRLTTLHLLHGSDDPVIAAGHAREALQHLGVLLGDATLDIAKGVGHVLHPALIDSALFRLQNHIPHRTWREAMGAVPASAATPTTLDDDED
jgi:phospholipase/carboxylesterase